MTDNKFKVGDCIREKEDLFYMWSGLSVGKIIKFSPGLVYVQMVQSFGYSHDGGYTVIFDEQLNTNFERISEKEFLKACLNSNV